MVQRLMDALILLKKSTGTLEVIPHPTQGGLSSWGVSCMGVNNILKDGLLMVLLTKSHIILLPIVMVEGEG